MSTPRVILKWQDTNNIELGHRIYRSDVSMDIQNMPSPITTLNPNSTEYIDEAVIDGNFYYYRVSAYSTNGEEFSNEVYTDARISTVFIHDIFGDNSIVATYNFDGNPEDLGGNYNTTLIGKPTYVEMEYNDGVSCKLGDGVSIPNDALNIADWDGITISFWMSAFTTSTNYTVIFNKGYDDCISSRVFPNGNIHFRVVDINNTLHTLNTMVRMNSLVGINHFCYIYDSVLGIMRFYLNGEETASITGVGTIATVLSDLLFFRSAGLSRNGSGNLDQLRIFNRPLNINEVSVLYNERL